jgi:Fis family transcriptional regulator, factor for inversion stimulation protein
MSPKSDSKPLCHSVAESVDEFFRTLNGHKPNDLYKMILGQVEKPLFEITLRNCDGNQSRAAELLGINRATLRKKLNEYRITVKAGNLHAHQ